MTRNPSASPKVSCVSLMFMGVCVGVRLHHTIAGVAHVVHVGHLNILGHFARQCHQLEWALVSICIGSQYLTRQPFQSHVQVCACGCVCVWGGSCAVASMQHHHQKVGANPVVFFVANLCCILCSVPTSSTCQSTSKLSRKPDCVRQ